jgi:hypothetical protein
LTRAEQRHAKRLLQASDLLLKREASRLVRHADHLRKYYPEQRMDEVNKAPAVDGSRQIFTVQCQTFPDGHATCLLQVAAQGICFMHDDGETLIDVLSLSRLASWEVGSDASVLEIVLKTIYVQMSQGRTVAIEYDETALVETILQAACHHEDLCSDDFQLAFEGRPLYTNHTLLHYGIESGMTLQLAEILDFDKKVQDKPMDNDNAHATPVVLVFHTNEARDIANALLRITKEAIAVGDLPYAHVSSRSSSTHTASTRTSASSRQSHQWSEAQHNLWLRGKCAWTGKPHVPHFSRLVIERSDDSASGKSRSARLHDFLADSTQGEIEAWWMDADEHVAAELRRPVGVAVSIARVRAVFAACAQRRPGEIDEVFPSSSHDDGTGIGTVTLGTWMRMVGTQISWSFPRSTD